MRNYYTYEECKTEALKYKDRKDLEKNNPSVYKKISRNKWYELITHMPIIKWSYETCKEEALKYKTKKEFKKELLGAYLHATRRGFLDEICSHMAIYGNHYKRCIYAYEFPDKSVYVGLTYNLDKRDIEHKYKETSSVFNHINETGIEPILKQLTDYIEKEKAILIEAEKIKEYKENGFIILNKAKAGALGGNVIKWTKEACANVAITCKTGKELKTKYPNVYDACIRNKWLREVCNHMEMCKHNHYWTKELCLTEALKYSRKTQFQKNSNAAFVAARRNKWIDEICLHMK